MPSKKPFGLAEETAVRLMLRAQYLMVLYYSMTLYEDDDIPTACTNGVGLWISAKFWRQLTRDQRVTLMAHEVAHKMLLHSTRRGARDPMVWNEAGDLVINDMLVEAGFTPLVGMTIDGKPFNWLYDKDLVGKGKTTEGVYDLLIKRQEGKPQSGKGQPQPGPGQPGDGEPTPAEKAAKAAKAKLGPMQDVRDFGTGPDGEPVEAEEGQPETPEQFETKVRAEIQEAEMRAKIAGNAPGWMERVIDNAQHAKINWYDVLFELLRGLHKADYSWRRWSKREYAKCGILSPDMYEPKLGGVTLFVDCSGSIGPHDLGIYNGHTKDVLDQLSPLWVEVVYFDTQVMRVERFERSEYTVDGTMLKPRGGGGTDFRWFCHYVADMDEQPDVVLVLTDMYGPFGQEIENVPTFWLSTSSIKTAPFGTTININ